MFGRISLSCFLFGFHHGYALVFLSSMLGIVIGTKILLVMWEKYKIKWCTVHPMTNQMDKCGSFGRIVKNPPSYFECTHAWKECLASFLLIFFEASVFNRFLDDFGANVPPTWNPNSPKIRPSCVQNPSRIRTQGYSIDVILSSRTSNSMNLIFFSDDISPSSLRVD